MEYFEDTLDFNYFLDKACKDKKFDCDNLKDNFLEICDKIFLKKDFNNVFTIACSLVDFNDKYAIYANNQIFIMKTNWENQDLKDLQKILILFHELAHSTIEKNVRGIDKYFGEFLAEYISIKVLKESELELNLIEDWCLKNSNKFNVLGAIFVFELDASNTKLENVNLVTEAGQVMDKIKNKIYDSEINNNFLDQVLNFVKKG